MKRYITLFIILAMFAPISMIEAKGNKGDREKWFAQMREYKHKFLAQELGLSQAQQDKFFPIYDKMENEIFKVNSETRQLEKKVSKGNASDVEYEAAAKAIIELKQKESAIELKYFNQFKTVLSSKQLFLLKKAERKFAKELIKKRSKCNKK